MSTLSSASAAATCHLTPPKILVYSQEPDTRFLLFVILTALDCLVLESEDIDETAEIIRNFHPHLILLDVPYPFSSDISPLIDLRKDESFSAVPIISVSNYSKTNFEKLITSLSISRHLTKPIDFERLEDCLKENVNEYAAYLREKWAASLDGIIAGRV